MFSRRSLMAGSIAALTLPAPLHRLSAAESVQELTLAVSSTSFVLGGVLIGQQAGIFARDGLDLHISVMDSGNAAMAALISGAVPFAVAGPPEVLMARSRGQEMVIIANLYAGFAGSVVLGKDVVAKLGVAPTAPLNDRLRALNGLVLAVPSPTSVLLAPIREGAAQAGATARFTYMAQTAMPAALESNAIQGMVASYPFAGTPLVRGTGVLWVNGPANDLPPELAPASSDCVLVTEAYLKANPATVSKFQQSMVTIADFITKDQAAAKKALAAAYPKLSAQEVDLAFDQQWRNWTKPFLTEADMRQELKLLIASTKSQALQSVDVARTLAGRS